MFRRISSLWKRFRYWYKLRRFEGEPFSKPVPDDVKIGETFGFRYNLAENIMEKWEKIPVISNERAEERRQRQN